MGVSHLILKGESLIIVEAIRSTNDQEFSYILIIWEIQLLLFHFQSFNVLYVGRQGDKTMHILAWNAWSIVDTLQWWFNPPDFIQASLAVDAEGCSMV